MDVIDAAKYLAIQYEQRFDETITEMKLHKLLYFAQRECLVQKDIPLFDAEFQAWRFGPVLPEVRSAFSSIVMCNSIRVDDNDRAILDWCLDRYGIKDAWSLSRLTHGEYSWKKARGGLSQYDNSSVTIPITDIRVDASKIKMRREFQKLFEEA